MSTLDRRKASMEPPALRPLLRSVPRRHTTELRFERDAQAYLWRTGRGFQKTCRN